MSESILADPRRRAEALAQKINGYQFTGPTVLASVIEFNAQVVEVCGALRLHVTMTELPAGLGFTPRSSIAYEIPLHDKGLVEVAGIEAPPEGIEVRLVREELGDPAAQVDVDPYPGLDSLIDAGLVEMVVDPFEAHRVGVTIAPDEQRCCLTRCVDGPQCAEIGDPCDVCGECGRHCCRQPGETAVSA